MEDLLVLLKKHAIDVPPEFTGEYIRNGSFWFCGRKADCQGKIVLHARFGDWSTGFRGSWTDTKDLNPREKEIFNEELKKAAEEDRIEKERRWVQTAQDAATEWASFNQEGTSPYLERKGLPDLEGCRIETHELGNRLIVPARDASGRLWGYQRIYSEKLSIGTDKIFREGARKEGCFHALGELQSQSVFLVCEGISTALSLRAALPGFTVISCFDAGNLGPVARSLRALYPETHFTFCADDDRWPGENGKPSYTGETAAKAAAKAVGNAHVVLPVFPPECVEQKPTDFDDLRLLCGVSAVRTQVLVTESGAESGTKPETAPEKATAGQLEARLAHTLLDQYGDKLIRQGKDFFYFEDTHWRALDPLTAPDYFKKKLDQLAGGRLKFKDVASAYQRFFIHVPVTPHGVNFYAPNPLAQNFKNGTLHLVPASQGTYTFQLKPHSREDYLIHCHDFNFQEGTEPNLEFESCLRRIWSGDPDVEKKITSYFEVLGACLIPAFRKLVLFVGPPKSGKSTLILFAANMVQEDYRCSVDPTQFHGFNLQSMAGKLLNFDTDINLVKPITDSILKKVEDRQPMRIQRKGISDIYAPIPGIHLFGANRMPISSEGGEAYDRRMLIFRCDKYQPADGYIQDFAQHLWRQDPQGIVMRAIEGLRRLAQSGGHFTVPESSRDEISRWKKEQGDLVQDFLTDIQEGGVGDQNSTLLWSPEGEITRSALWENFVIWMSKSAPDSWMPGKIKFYGRLRQLGIKEKRTEEDRYFLGISLKAGAKSAM